MIFAVSMTFIDQTIVAIAIPSIQDDLSLSSTGVQWTWRAIFWVNIPVAIVALFLTWKAKPDDTRRPAPLDYRGTVLITGGMAVAFVVALAKMPAGKVEEEVTESRPGADVRPDLHESPGIASSE